MHQRRHPAYRRPARFVPGLTALMILTTSPLRPVPSSSRAHDHDRDTKHGGDSHVEFDQQSTTDRYLDAGYRLRGGVCWTTGAGEYPVQDLLAQPS